MSRKLAISFLIAIFLISSYFVFAVDRQEGTPPDGDIAVTFCEEGFVNKLVQSESKNRYEYQCVPTIGFCDAGEQPIKSKEDGSWQCYKVDHSCDSPGNSFSGFGFSENGERTTVSCSSYRPVCEEDQALVKISANEFSCEDVALLPKCDLRETIQLSISGGEKTFTCVEGIFNKNVENPDCFEEVDGNVVFKCEPVEKDIDIIFDADTENKEIKGTGTFERIKVKLDVDDETEWTVENYPRNVPCGWNQSVKCFGRYVYSYRDCGTGNYGEPVYCNQGNCPTGFSVRYGNSYGVVYNPWYCYKP